MTRIDSNYSTHYAPTESLADQKSIGDLAVELGGGPEAYLAAMVMTFAKERSDTARNQRAQIEEHIAKTQAEEVAHMHEQADEMRSGAFWGAAGGVIAGGLTIGAGVAVADDSGEWSKYLQGGGDISKGLGDGAGKYFDATSSDRGADAASSRNRASAAERRLEVVNDDLASARDLQKSALDFLDQANETRAQTQQSVSIRG